MNIIDGKALSLKIKDKIKSEIPDLINQCSKTPKLAVVLVGDDPASAVYVRNKKKACAYVGIESVSVELDNNTTMEQLESQLTLLNNDPTINGILLQLPLPSGLDARTALNHISPSKDVDGLTNVNMGSLITSEDGLFACTPSGIMEMLNEYNISLDGKNVVIINRSLLVGRPLSSLMLRANATVTVCHRHTKNLSEHTKRADIIVTAVGKKNFLTSDMVKEGAVVIDVAIVRTEDGLCGDADFEGLKNKVEYISPVPGGVGPMTIAMLLSNTLKAYKKQNNL